MGWTQKLELLVGDFVFSRAYVQVPCQNYQDSNVY